MPILPFLLLLLAFFATLAASTFVLFYDWDRYEQVKHRKPDRWFPIVIFSGWAIAALTCALAFAYALPG